MNVDDVRRNLESAVARCVRNTIARGERYDRRKLEAYMSSVCAAMQVPKELVTITEPEENHYVVDFDSRSYCRCTCRSPCMGHCSCATPDDCSVPVAQRINDWGAPIRIKVPSNFMERKDGSS